MSMIRPNPHKPCFGDSVVAQNPQGNLPPLIPSWSSPRILKQNDIRPRSSPRPLQFINAVDQNHQQGIHSTNAVDQNHQQGIHCISRSSSPWTIESRDLPSLQSSTQGRDSAFSPFPFQQTTETHYAYYDSLPRVAPPSSPGFVPIQSEDEPRRVFTPNSRINSPFITSTPTKGKDSPAATVETAPLSVIDSPANFGGRFMTESPNLHGYRTRTPSSIALRTPTPSSPFHSPESISLHNSQQTTPGNFTPTKHSADYCALIGPGITNRPVSTVPVSKPPNGRVLKARPKSAPTLGCRTAHYEDEMARKMRIKTELCMHYENGRECPFGDNCTYAHGEEELQMTKLVDLHDAGLVDMDTYRVKPCWTWVATGSCPFGKRCIGIHDTRCTSQETNSWLPHTETQGNTMATDINVESLYQKRLNSILYNNPFGNQFHMTSSTFDDLYRLANGMDQPQQNSWQVPNKQRKVVHPIYKLQIALKLRGASSDWQYKFRPQHTVQEDLCMVLQSRAFRVDPNDATSRNRLPCSAATALSSVVEIGLNKYDSRRPNHIIVHELAFGPDSDPTVRGVALWFNIAEHDITVCTPQQAKRFRWKKQGTNFKKKTVDKVSVFDSGLIESIPMIRPHDSPAYNLVTHLMQHRLQFLQCDLQCNLRARFDHLQTLQQYKKELQRHFFHQRRDWMAWAWPADSRRECVDASTPVPAIEGPYSLLDSKSHASSLWKSFVANMEVCNLDQGFLTGFAGERVSDVFCDGRTLTVFSPQSTSSGASRLPIFVGLQQGLSVDPSQRAILPHILKHRAYSNKGEGSTQDRCWKSLLLASEHENNEWCIVRSHFEKSRSKKVLSILQQ